MSPTVSELTQPSRHEVYADFSHPVGQEKDVVAEEKSESIYDLFDTKSFRYWESEHSKGRVPTSIELADLLEANSDRPLPSWLIPLVAKDLRGELKRRGGRPPATALQNILLRLASSQYYSYLSWLQKRERRSGLRGWALIKEKDWWVGPPHERAARIVTARWLKHADWRGFLNRLSSQKRT